MQLQEAEAVAGITDIAMLFAGIAIDTKLFADVAKLFAIDTKLFADVAKLLAIDAKILFPDIDAIDSDV